MALTLRDVVSDTGEVRLTDAQVRRLSKADRAALLGEASGWLRRHQRESQLTYYRPISEAAAALHRSRAKLVGVQGGNRSGKSATMLAELAIALTGHVPTALRATYPAGKWPPPPIRARLVVSSLTATWDINLKPKLQWTQWNGKLADGVAGDPDKGLWGLLPRRWLLGGDWERSWSEKHRLLTLNRRGDGGLEPGSTLQVMSVEQDLTDFDQGAFHVIVEDEIPPEAIHRANQMRTLDFGGRILVGGTPRDEDTAAVASGWFFDQVIQPGLAGTDPEVCAVVLWTEHNRTLDAADVAFVTRGLTPQQARARLRGETLHLEGLVYPGVQARPAWACLDCGTWALAGEACPRCEGTRRVRACHVWDDGAEDAPPAERLADWPVVFLIDPHQSRPAACAWVAVDPQDQWWQVGELEVSGGAAAVKQAVLGLERDQGWRVVRKLGDPKITMQTNQYAREFEGEPFTIRRAYEDVGFDFEEANTNFTVGRERVLEALAVNPLTGRPRLRFSRACTRTLYALTHHTWETSRHGEPRTKEIPARRHSDFPALLRYLALDDPDYAGCQRAGGAARVLHVGAAGARSVVGW